jgi:hypothetical protein
MFVAHVENAAPAVASAGRAAELRILPFRLLLAATLSRYRARAARDVLLRALYGATSGWCARHGAVRRSPLQRMALWLRRREDRVLERLEWLGAFENERRVPAEKWVYRRLAAERRRGAPEASQSRPRPEKWLAAIGRERGATSVPRGTEAGP